MFKRRVNEVRLEVEISPRTPLLIKASDSGADPSRPDMEFVTTYIHGKPSIYIPGSSLKGAIRSHAERIVRTVGGTDSKSNPWSCDPLDRQSPCQKPKEGETEEGTYKRLCTACRIFGCMRFASHFDSSDAYPDSSVPVVLEERNGVALDRTLGSAASGALFNYQVATDARFRTLIKLVNFSLDQLGLLALVLRDMDEQRMSLGFAKSKGFGQVKADIKSVLIRYPGCILKDGIRIVQMNKTLKPNEVAGAGVLFEQASSYGYPKDDLATVETTAVEDDLQICVEQRFDEKTMPSLWKASVAAWKKQMGATVR